MKAHNLKEANRLVAELEKLKVHQRDFTSIQTDSLPEDQFNAQQNYAKQLEKSIKTIEKRIEEL